MNSNEKRLFYFLFAAIIALAFFQIWTAINLDIQPWDEALYAVRAKAAASGAFLDQTRYSAGGLYSSAHPPLFIWLNAISISLFGESQIAYRITPILFGLLILVAIYKKADSKLIGLIACAFAFSTQLFQKFSLQSQLDIALTFFMTLCAIFYQKYTSENQTQELKRASDKYLYYAAISLGLALMSKAVFGVLAFGAIAIFEMLSVWAGKRPIKSALKNIAILFAIAFAISAPWHIFMYVKYGLEFINYYAFFHVYQRMIAGVEHNAKSLGAFYFLNQVFIFAPFIWLIISDSLIFRVKKGGRSLKEGALKLMNNGRLLFYLQFAIIFIVISVSKSKLQSYLLPAMPALIIAVASLIIEKYNEIVPKSLGLIAILSLLWSISQEYRDAVQSFHFGMTLIIGTLIIVSAIAIYWALRNKIRYVHLSAFIAVAMLTRAFVYPPPFIISNMNSASKEYYQKPTMNFILLEPNQSSFASNPLITFYFNGIDLRKDSNYIFYSNENEINEFIKHIPNDSYIMLVKEDSIKAKYRFDDSLKKYANIVYESERFAGYRR